MKASKLEEVGQMRRRRGISMKMRIKEYTLEKKRGVSRMDNEDEALSE